MSRSSEEQNSLLQWGFDVLGGGFGLIGGLGSGVGGGRFDLLERVLSGLLWGVFGGDHAGVILPAEQSLGSVGGLVPSDVEVDDSVVVLRDQLREREHEIEDLRAGLREARMTGIAVGVLLARTPGWTEQDAWAAWEGACARLTRSGNTKALASYVVQTGKLPGAGVTAQV